MDTFLMLVAVETLLTLVNIDTLSALISTCTKQDFPNLHSVYYIDTDLFLSLFIASLPDYLSLISPAGFACYAGAEYQGDQRVTGDLRVTSSPNPEVTVTVKTPWTNWEQLSATGAFQDDGWGKKEVRFIYF